MKIQQQITTNLEPIEIESSLKYKCPCGIDHWAYLREVCEEGFFIVCFCKNKLYPKTVRSVDMNYTHNAPHQHKQTKDNISNSKLEDVDTPVPSDIMEKCCVSMEKLGFTKKEAAERLNKAHKKNPTLTDKELIKLALLEN